MVVSTLAIPGESPSTRVDVPLTSLAPGNPAGPALDNQRANLRDALKQVRHESGPPLGAVRVLQDYLAELIGAADSPEFANAEFRWRLPWTAPALGNKKTRLIGLDSERVIATVTLIMLLTRAADQAWRSDNSRQATAHLTQAAAYARYLELHSGASTPIDISGTTASALTRICIGLLHRVAVDKTLAAAPGTAVTAASASVHARVAVYAADQFGAAAHIAPKIMTEWLKDHRSHCLASARVFLAVEASSKGQLGLALGQLKAVDIPRNTKDQTGQHLLQIVAHLSKSYESENGIVAFQAVVDPDKLPQLPAGRAVIEPAAWVPAAQRQGSSNNTSTYF